VVEGGGNGEGEERGKTIQVKKRVMKRAFPDHLDSTVVVKRRVSIIRVSWKRKRGKHKEKVDYSKYIWEELFFLGGGAPESRIQLKGRKKAGLGGKKGENGRRKCGGLAVHV